MNRKGLNSNSQPYIIELGDRSYPVHVKPGLIEDIGDLIKDYIPSFEKCAIVTSDPIWSVHGKSLLESLEKKRINVTEVWVPDGEEAKTWYVAEKLIGDLLENNLDKQSVIIGFGGGAVGDVTGFVASIYLRGVRLIQVPTTLLAQIDSSLGGKTAVNHPKGKNLIGSFHQPSMVFSDTNLLRTLPRKEILSGLGEAVKHGVIADQALFAFIENNASKLVNADPEALSYVVRRSVVIKGSFVTLDERDSSGVRAALNYGHTTGHVLEILSKLEIRHGEAVARGMMIASRVSESLGLINKDETERQRRLLIALGFDLSPPHISTSVIVEMMLRDKKVLNGSIRFVLPTGIGAPPVLKVVSENYVFQALEKEGYE
jgi:3-dehydroquinate synthase